MKITAKSSHQFPIIVAVLFGLAVVARTYPALAESFDSDHIEAYFKAKFGYVDIDCDQFFPTALDYVSMLRMSFLRRSKPPIIAKTIHNGE